MKRRNFIASAALPVLALWGCGKPHGLDAQAIEGGFTGAAHERGHLLRDNNLRDQKAWPAPGKTTRTRVVIAGGGVAGLAAARALRLNGVEDFALLELEDQAGGNSRAGSVNGIACPLGAHYLPVPGDDAPEVQNFLEELGLRQRVAGRWVYDERHLCHSPQERLFFRGEWQDGLLPLQDVGRDTLAQYQKFADLVAQARQSSTWTIPVSKSPSSHEKQALLAITFVAYLNQHQLTDPHLRWYLDYCCKDDYGAGIATVSAWAGLHYFASRHGFHAPSSGAAASSADSGREGVLTWPEGNGWLTRHLANPLKDRLHTGWLVTRIEVAKHGVEVDAFHPATQSTQRWQADQCIVALPMFVAARVVQNPPQFLLEAAAKIRYAPWLVANIHLHTPLHDRPGAAPSWDNVVYNPQNHARDDAHNEARYGESLGYVDAMHQNLRSVAGPTVLTHYRALGDVPEGRKRLLQTPWAHWRDLILAELSAPHPDLAAKTSRIDITRYGHAMAIPVPRSLNQDGPQVTNNLGTKLSKNEQSNFPVGTAKSPLRFAHSDWAGYSVFEEAFTMGHLAGQIR